MGYELKPATQKILEELTRYRAHELLEMQLEDERRAGRRDRQIPASLSRALAQMATPGGGLQGAEAQYAKATAGDAFDPHKLILPYSALGARTLIAATASAGGDLIGVNVEDTVDALRPWSVVVQGGITVLPGLTADTRVPFTSADPTLGWQADEVTGVTPDDPVLGAALLQPKIASLTTPFTKQSLVQSGNAIEAWVRTVFLRALGVLVDVAVLNGAGSSGEPTGILNATPSSETGTSLALTGVLAMKKNALDANAQESAITFLADTATSTLLEGRVTESGGGRTIWQDGKVANCAAYATTTMPDNTLLSGPFERVVLGLFGAGVELAVDPFTAFKSNIISVRITLLCDVGLSCAATAFTAATSVT